MDLSTPVRAVVGDDRPEPTTTFDTLDPSTGTVLATMAAASDEQVDRAVGTARRAQPSWQATDVVTRSRLVADLATRIRAEADELARLESHDTGKPLSQARVDVEQCAEYFDFAAAGVACSPAR